jgi:oligosaccharyltransferase complex subunit gamma
MIAAKRRMGGGGRVFAVFLLLGLCVISPPVVFADTNADRVAELLHRQSKSKDGVIHLDESSFRRFMSTSDPRPYSLVIFFDASQLRDNRELRLEEFRKEFGLASLAYIKHNKGSTNAAAASRVFFCDLEFKQSQQVFKLFGVTTLPHIRYIPPGNGNVDESEEMSQSEFPRSAEGMSMFVEAKTKQKSAAIERPPPISKWQMWFLVLAFLATTPFIIKKLIAPDSPMREPRLWCTIAILVYFFSVSGGMHNIIRRMPLFMQDRNQPGKLLFFYQGSGMQLGAEGFVVGFLYTVVGLLLGFITQFAARIKSRMVQQILVLVGIAISFLAVRKVVLLDNWKTGYWIHAFWPTRWT